MVGPPSNWGPPRPVRPANFDEESTDSEGLMSKALLASAAPRALGRQQRAEHAKKRLVTAAFFLAAAGLVAAVCAFAPQRRGSRSALSGTRRRGSFVAPQRAWGDFVLIPAESEKELGPAFISAAAASPAPVMTSSQREAAAKAVERLQAALRSGESEATVRALLQEVQGAVSLEQRPQRSLAADHHNASRARTRDLADGGDDEEACADTAGKATDDDNDGCDWYNSFGFHHEDCGLHDDSDFSALAMCCECSGGLRGHYQKLQSGSCANPVSSIGECSHAAKVLGLDDVLASDDGRYPGSEDDPPFCYYEDGVLKFNSGENYGPCSHRDHCICGPGGSAATETPAPTEGPDTAVNTASDHEVCTATTGLNILAQIYPCKCGTATCELHQVCDLEANACKHEECPDQDGIQMMPLATFKCKCGDTFCSPETVCDASIGTCYKAVETVQHEEDGEHQHMHDQAHDLGHEEHTHSMPLLFFVLVTLSVGCVMQVVQERMLPSLPYTCMLFVLGLIFAIFHHFRPDAKGDGVDIQWSPTWYHSVEMWEKSDPHALFFTFLPALIFADAMKMNAKLIQKVFAQVVTLACPGVLLGTFMTAAFVKYVFYMYEWPDHLCVLFGSITAATDPVAVVALFNTLGVSPRLTMLVSGESLLNDGTAIVLFQITLQILTGEATLTPLFVIRFICEVVFLAVIFGALVAGTFQVLIFNTAESKYHTDAMIQVTVSICVAFLCFWYSEHELKASGVLAVVFAGGVFSIYAWPRFASKEAMHLVWEAIEFLGNTMIFTIGGLLFGAGVLDHSEDFEHVAQDIGLLFLLYLGSTLIRFVMIVVLLPFLNCIGPKITFSEVIVMTWSGLRGAVAIVLAIMVDLTPSINSANRARFMFHIGGMAMLTTLVNAPLAKPLLEYLGMTDIPVDENRANAEMEELANNDMREFYETMQANKEEDTRDERFYGHEDARLKEMVPYLDLLHGQSSFTKVITNSSHAQDISEEEVKEQRVRTCREIFMRMVHHIYWLNMDEGVIQKAGKVARHLIYSCQDALEDTHNPLHDWTEVLEHTVTETSAWPIMSQCVSVFPFNLLLPLQEMFPSEDRVKEWKVRTALCYLQAHKQCRLRMMECFGDHDKHEHHIFAAAQKTVFEESNQQCQKATETMNQVDEDIRKVIKSKMLAGKLIHHHLHKISEMVEEGLLSAKGASAITHHLHHKYRSVNTGSHLSMPVSKASAILKRQGSNVDPLTARR